MRFNALDRLVENAPIRRGCILKSAKADDTLAKLGWVEGRNLRTELRWGTGDTERMHDGAVALVGLTPDVILVSSTPAARAVRQLSKTVPIIFVTPMTPSPLGWVSPPRVPRRRYGNDQC